MNEVVYLIFRRMRRPALVLICCYAIAVLGMHLIPTLDEDGEISRLTIFQSFYWISYTATTIGYGEVPVNFSAWQRVWVAISVYYTVPAWLYAAGKIIALLGDSVFQQALAENRFTRHVQKLDHRFVLICGFGEAGKRLARLLVASNYSCVVIDTNADRINRIALEPELQSVLAINADASDVDYLIRAGIRSPNCRAVVAITDNENVNIKIALSARLLSTDRTRLKIICRTMTEQGTINAKSFSTDSIINTNKIFVERLTMGLRRPALAELLIRLRGIPKDDFKAPSQPPQGDWVICGYGTLGETLDKFLAYEGIDATIISDVQAKVKNRQHVHGVGTNVITLREANLAKSAAIVCAHGSDADNLSIALTAKTMNPSLFVAGRQNQSSNAQLFSVAGFDYLMEEADLLVSEIFPYLARPMLNIFINKLKHQDENWGNALLQRINKLSPNKIPSHCILKIDNKHAPAIVEYLKSGHLLRMHSLWTQSDIPDSINDVFPLMLIRGNKEILLPKSAINLQINDKLLLIYKNDSAVSFINRNIQDSASLYHTLHNRETITSPVLTYILKKWQ